jgi:hypothetical protein
LEYDKLAGLIPNPLCLVFVAIFRVSKETKPYTDINVNKADHAQVLPIFATLSATGAFAIVSYN